MIRHVWSIICEKAIVDQESNNISLIASMERLAFAFEGPLEVLEGISGIPLDCELVTYWVRNHKDEPSRSRSRIRLLTPDTKDYVEIGGPTEVDLREFERLRARHRIGVLPYRGPGRYCFSVEYDRDGEWVMAAEIPLDIEGPTSVLT